MNVKACSFFPPRKLLKMPKIAWNVRVVTNFANICKCIHIYAHIYVYIYVYSDMYVYVYACMCGIHTRISHQDMGGYS